jgi:phosphatidylglycerophosphate synthase
MKSEFMREWSRLHGDVSPSRVVIAWLNISYQLAKALSVMRFTPNALTLVGLGVSILAPIFAPNPASALFVVIALIIDGCDGSLAIISQKVSVKGAIWDSLADRTAEGLWAIALWRIGVPIWLVTGLWILATTQEYLRARFNSQGNNEIGIVTVAERPVRALVTAVSLIFYPVVTSLVLLALQLHALRSLSKHIARELSH